ncbi:hypothetical protein [Celeribacter baekdonensis]|uniref:hypothetical protein n=1 Tax=Celeribacter baekdonensis TaxID=875171 RepID=UPI0026EAA752|nr:hypothetical protein [Celeribacter baekdonensis]|tara:strand:+ start:3524 stop:4039 length:516 start_codon:yes stop_codon:yes gene_type:complete
MFFKQTKRAHFARAPKLFAFGVSALSATLLMASMTTAAHAARPNSQVPGATIVITGDPGGSVRERYNEIRQINQLGQKVEIRRGNCMSSCTMFLGANDVCVSPQAVLGFHGPSNHGAKLAPDKFDKWSRVIASHYPEAIRNWYMTNARFKIYSATRLSGTELIRLGVRPCP